jgi:hypothetical protein
VKNWLKKMMEKLNPFRRRDGISCNDWESLSPFERRRVKAFLLGAGVPPKVTDGVVKIEVEKNKP